MPIVQVDDLFANWKMKILLYGRSGTGKTYLAGMAALVKEMCPVYWFATERGMLSIKDILGTGRVRVMLANSAGDLAALQNVIANPGKIKTVVIDSLSELHALIIRTEMKDPEAASPGRNEYRVGHDRILKLARYIGMHNSLHVIATCNDQPLIDGETGRILSMDPDMAGKLSFRVTRYFDLVGYLKAKSDPSLVPGKLPAIHRWLQVMNFDGVAAKDRSGGKLGAMVADPTMATLYEALVGPCTVLPLARETDTSLMP